MTNLRNNVLANFGGQTWSVLMSLAFVPMYIRILGIEAYGLIGFFISLQAFFLIFDMGLSATVNRELARHRHVGTDADAQRDLVRTLEWLYWPMGLLIAAGAYLASGSIAGEWLKPVSLGVDGTAHAIVLMGLSAGLQWPCGFYAGGFRGLERQVELNGINAFFATLRYAGVIVVLLLFSPTLEAFLWWQILMSLLQVAALRTMLWRLLPDGQRAPTFRLKRLRELLGFAIGLAGIGALSFLLTQSDRLILSTMIPLDQFGYYSIAAVVATALSAVVQPFFAALYPRFSGLVATGQRKNLITLYHQSNQLMAAVVISAAAVLILFAPDVLLLWTRDPKIATNSSLILSILAAGTALNGLMNLPYALQLANGWTRLALIQNAIAVLLVLPALWWLAGHYGGPGAASVWLALNMGYVAIGIPVMHRKLLKNEMRKWYLHDILPPALAALIVAGALRLLIPNIPVTAGGVVMLGLISFITLSAAGLAAPFVRAHATHTFARWVG